MKKDVCQWIQRPACIGHTNFGLKHELRWSIYILSTELKPFSLRGQNKDYFSNFDIRGSNSSNPIVLKKSSNCLARNFT